MVTKRVPNLRGPRAAGYDALHGLELSQFAGQQNNGEISEHQPGRKAKYSPLSSLSLFSSNRSGWRKVLPLAIVATAIVLLINLAFGIWLLKRGNFKGGIGTISEGSCSTTSNASLVIHLFINILSTILLSASNYVMQCLAAPVREEVDQAHERSSWLDIGIPSARNLRQISRKRVALLILVGISSVPLHLMYNSVVFKVISANNYVVGIVTADFANGAAFNDSRSNDSPSILDAGSPFINLAHDKPASIYPFEGLQANISELDSLSNLDCINAYRNSISSRRRNVLLITTDNPYNDGSLVMWTESRPYLRQYAFDPIGWICSWGPASNFHAPHCDVDNIANSASDWRVMGYPITHCLSESIPEKCQLQASLAVLLAVVLCNIAKLIAMFLAMRALDDRHLMTVGDAVASFLEREDSTTRDLSLASKADVATSWTSLPRDGLVFKPRKYRFFHSISHTRWTTFGLLSGAALCTSVSLLYAGIKGMRRLNAPTTISALTKMGLGTVTTDSLLKLGGDISPGNNLVGYILLTNLPQLVVSSIYLLYNALYTAMTLAEEWANFGTKRKTLRVSAPKGGQRSTYYLQLPYIYAVPLLITSATLHWLISQSIFLVRIRVFDTWGNDEPADLITTAGYSCIGIIFSIIVGGCMVLACILTALRYLPNHGPPLGSNCSFIISAACHPEADRQQESTTLSLQPVQWGVVRRNDNESVDIPHCSFSAETVEFLIPGHRYR